MTQLGVNVMVKTLGLCGYFLICISLIIGPLSVIKPTEFVQLIEPRRAVGLTAFVFALFHYALVAGGYFGFDFNALFSYPSNIIGFVGLMTLVLLAAASNDYSMKLLGPVNWKRIQMVNYLTFIIVSVHFILVLKGDILSNALLGLGLITIILQFWGFFTKRDRIQKMKQTTPNS